MSETTDASIINAGTHPITKHVQRATLLLDKVNETMQHPVGEDDLDIIDLQLKKAVQAIREARRTLGE